MGLLLGTAIGDALGLPMENLSPERIRRRWAGPLQMRFVFGRGMISNDTEHTIMVSDRGLLPRFPAALSTLVTPPFSWAIRDNSSYPSYPCQAFRIKRAPAEPLCPAGSADIANPSPVSAKSPQGNIPFPISPLRENT